MRKRGSINFGLSSNPSGGGVGTTNDPMRAGYAVHWPFPEFREGTNYEHEADVPDGVRRARRAYSSSSSEASFEADGVSDHDASTVRSETTRADSVAGSDLSALHAFRKAQQRANSLRDNRKCSIVAPHPLSSDWNLTANPRSYRDHLRHEIARTAIAEERQLTSNIQRSHLKVSNKVRSVLSDHLSTISSATCSSGPHFYGSSGAASRAPSSRGGFGDSPSSAGSYGGVAPGRIRPSSAAPQSQSAARGLFTSGDGELGGRPAAAAAAGSTGDSHHAGASVSFSIDDLTLLIRLFAGGRGGGTAAAHSRRSGSPSTMGSVGASSSTAADAIAKRHMSLEWLGVRHGFSRQVVPPLVNLHLGNFASHVSKCDGDIGPDRVLINSPRSAVVLLRAGMSVAELIPRPAVVRKARVLAAKQLLKSQTQRGGGGGGASSLSPSALSPTTADGAASGGGSSSNPSNNLTNLNKFIGANAGDLTLSKAEEEIERLRLQRLQRLVAEYVALCEVVSLEEVITFCSQFDKARPSSALRLDCTLTTRAASANDNYSSVSAASTGHSHRRPQSAVGRPSTALAAGAGAASSASPPPAHGGRAGNKIGDLLPEAAAEEKFQRLFDRHAAFERTVVQCQQKVIADDEAKREAALQRLRREEERSAKLVAMREARLEQRRDDREAREAVKRLQQAAVDRARAYKVSALREPIIRRDDEVANIAKARQRAILRYKTVIVQDIHKDDVKKKNVSAARAAGKGKVTWDAEISKDFAL